MRYRHPTALFAALFLPSLALAAPQAQIAASRTSGPAPLAVFFDATATTDTNSSVDPFRQLGYRFDFADSLAGTWGTTGESKNQQVGGPLAAHVFDSPGTYRVSVTARDADGNSSVANVTITVLSPDESYSGTRTVCLSRTTDVAGCPGGAQRITGATAWPAFQSGYRYLLRRGQDFSALGNVNFGSSSAGLSDAQLGAYGSGEKPIVRDVYIQSGYSGVSTGHNRVVVMDLNARNIFQVRVGRDVLLYRNSLLSQGMIEFAVLWGYDLERATGTWRNPENIFLVENVIDRNFNTSANENPSGVTGNGVRIALLGNTITRTAQHNVRLWQGAKVVIAHNNITGVTSESIRHALKIHSNGLDAISETISAPQLPRQRSSELVIADNNFGSSTSPVNWITAIGPENLESIQGTERVIFEDNAFRYGSNYFRDVTWVGRNFTDRGNTNATANRAASVGELLNTSLPSTWVGPYFYGQPSMKLRFAGMVAARPLAPALLVE
jgi:PKD repeat protein